MRIHANRSIKVIYSIVALTTITALAISSCKTVYKVGLTVLNPTKDTIRSIGYQSDFAVDPSSSAPLLSTKPLPPDSSFRYEKKLKIEQGKNLYLFAGTNRTNSAIYNSTIKINESNSNLIVGLKAIDSTSVYKRTSDIQNWFESVSEGIIDSRNRMPYLTSQLSNIMTLLPAILIVDSTAWQLAVKNKGLLEKNSNNLSFYTASDLKITPAPIILGGEDKVKKIRIESNGNIESSFKFPFAANLNLNISSEGLYDVNLKILAAGWVPIKSQNGATPLEAIFSLDSIGSRSTLLDMLRQLQKGRRAKVVTSAYMYQGLTIQTTKYDKIRTDFSGAYASVLSTNGAYQRSESEDFVNTLPTTITHVEIGNDVTEALKENLELIVSSVYLQNKASGKTNTSEVSELVPDSIKAITGNYEAELKKLQLEIEILKKKNRE